jgi:phosphatidylserine/phosphatidylglycerophosphate/cardiolipin synthase-like enzyme
MINMEGNPYFYALSTLPNAEVRIYNAINPLCPWTLMGRMHDKYVIVDDDLYLLGGRNTRRFFLGEHEGAKNYDWDVLVTHDGDEDGSLSQLETYFYSIWNSENATVFHNQLSLGQTPSVNRAAAKLQDIHDAQVANMPEVFQSYDYQQVTVPVEQVTLLSGQTQILSKEPQVFYTLCQLMGQATEDVTIHTPYIACNEYMLEELSKLSDNGAEIRLMTNSPANNGNLFGAAFYYSEDKQALLDAGFHLMEYDGGYSYHGKCIAVDDDLSMVGSFNLDMRSTYLDTELMLVIDSQEFNSWLREDMQTYEETALQVVDADTVLAPEGQEVQELSDSRQFMFSVVNALLGWAKFLV